MDSLPQKNKIEIAANERATYFSETAAFHEAVLASNPLRDLIATATLTRETTPVCEAATSSLTIIDEIREIQILPHSRPLTQREKEKYGNVINFVKK